MVRRKTVKKKTAPKKKIFPQSPAPSATKFSDAANAFWENLDWSDLTDTFDNRTTQRGRNYAESGHVQNLWNTEDGTKLLAVVSGSEEYQTLVSLEKKSKKKFHLSSFCSCPVGYDCKHGVATIGVFLDRLAKGQAIPICTESKNGEWEAVSSSGKKMKLKIEPYDDDEEDDWFDDDDDWKPVLKRIKTVAPKLKPKDAQNTKALQKKLAGMSQEELVKLVLQLARDHASVKEQFEQEAFVESVAKTGSTGKLLQKAIELIDKGIDCDTDYHYYDRYDHGGGSINLDGVEEIIRQFKKQDDPLDPLDKIARYLIKKGGEYFENTGAEDAYEIEAAIDLIGKVLLESKIDKVRLILWVHELSRIGEYDLTSSMKRTVFERKWPVKTWSGVANTLLEKIKNKPGEYLNYWYLRKTVEALDHAKRGNEATDLLRTEAVKIGDHDMLVDRLIDVGALDEAEKLATEQLKKSESGTSHYHRDHLWIDRLMKIAEKRKDWSMLASIQASEMFHEPTWHEIKALLKTVKKLEAESAILKSLDQFLQTGALPAAVEMTLAGEKPSASAKRSWPLPVFFNQQKPKKPEPCYDILCKWAIEEKRADDVIRWFDEMKNKQSQRQNIDLIEVANAVVDSWPERALTIYRQAAEREMEQTRDYQKGVSHLKKVKTALEYAGRSGEWPKIIEEVRTTHRRKTNLMKLLNELEAGSIVKQKRREK